MSVVPSNTFRRLRTESPIDRITIGKRRPLSVFQTADAKILSIGKPRPLLFLEMTKSGPQTIPGSDPVSGRTADAAGLDQPGRSQGRDDHHRNRPARSRVRPTINIGSSIRGTWRMCLRPMGRAQSRASGAGGSFAGCCAVCTLAAPTHHARANAR